MHRLCGGGDRRIDVAFVDQGPRRRRIGAQRRFDVLQVRQRRRRLPAHLELRRRLDRILLALGNDADEITDPDDRDQPRNIAHRRLIDRDQTVADEGACIDAGVGRTHDAAVPHAGHAYVMNIDGFADLIVERKLDRNCGWHWNVVGQFKPDGLAGNQFTIADAAVVLPADQAVFDRKIFDGKLEPFRRARDQKMPRLRGGFAQGDRRDLDGFAGDGRALIGNARGIAQHDDDARKGHVEFFGDDLSERGANAGAEIDMTVERSDRTVGRYFHEGFECTFPAGSSRTNHRERSGPKLTIVRRPWRHQSCASARAPAARIAARMISICAPHRHKL